MKQLFENADINAMRVIGVTPKCVRLSDDNGDIYFISHSDFNLVMSEIKAPLMFIKRKSLYKNQYGMETEITFLERVQRVVPQEVREKWMSEE